MAADQARAGETEEKEGETEEKAAAGKTERSLQFLWGLGPDNLSVMTVVMLIVAVPAALLYSFID